MHSIQTRTTHARTGCFLKQKCMGLKYKAMLHMCSFLFIHPSARAFDPYFGSFDPMRPDTSPVTKEEEEEEEEEEGEES